MPFTSSPVRSEGKAAEPMSPTPDQVSRVNLAADDARATADAVAAAG